MSTGLAERVFGPISRLLDRLPYASKFGAIFAVLLIGNAILFVQLYGHSTRELRSAERQLEGLDLFDQGLELVLAAQVHRGLSTGYISGEVDMGERMTHARAVLAERLTLLDRRLKANAAWASLYDGWKPIRTELDMLVEHGLHMSSADNFHFHTRAIGLALSWMMDLTDVAGLYNHADPLRQNLQSASLRTVPALIEAMGQLRGLVTGYLAQARANPAVERSILLKLGELRLIEGELNSRLEKVARHSPELAGAVASALGELFEATERIRAAINDEVIAGRFGLGASEYFDLNTAAIALALSHYHELLEPAVRDQLNTHVAGSRSAQAGHLLIAGGIILLAAYLFGGIYHSIRRSVAELVDGAHRFGEGRLDGTVMLSANDELRQVAERMNAMARELSADITALEQARAQLELAASVFSHAREGIAITDADGTILDVNEAFTRITGYAREEVVGHTPRLLKSGHQDDDFYTRMWRELQSVGHWSGEIWNRHKSGKTYPEMLTIAAVRDDDERITGYVSLFTDITRQKADELRLRQMAHFDPLTGLANRILLIDRLEQALARNRRGGALFAVAYIDLDGFKAINDLHGHHMGDHLLITLARRMKACLRAHDTVARLGGDEFVVLLTELHDLELAKTLVERLLEQLQQPVEIDGLRLQVSGSIGIAVNNPGADVDADRLLRHADHAMYQAKSSGKNRFCVFAGMQAEAEATPDHAG